MERKKLKFMDVNEEDVLGREQMRNIMAGSGCGGGGDCYGDNSCLVCKTPNGVESWYRTNTTLNPTSECKKIYHYGCGGSSEVTGRYGICSHDAHCS